MTGETSRYFFFACASAEAAADFALALVLPSLKTAEAADAAFADVVLGGATCDMALPAAVFEAAPVLGLVSTAEAFVAADLPVTLVAMEPLPFASSASP